MYCFYNIVECKLLCINERSNFQIIIQIKWKLILDPNGYLRHTGLKEKEKEKDSCLMRTCSSLTRTRKTDL